ncbi:MAG TPA: PP2C family protein-serine/threonine phosphatase [Thermoanaerobaculales bacterium]|nr:PP2C family protein-serine/threonine phosphatase [Thermoanaerobaculales bacterium]HPA81355.1 PP2C family protein-serine/threonine phosphatase [Thermoanaerobaculales bacterium]HQL29368.1 PP2C family protein-serine/threonine phosphatase [Thermoanaerobaculales bacterium]HQN96050.1 PP2C family protein-serine/threonine phosphatase [Thermoanaerobaculales bacterium]HQP44185.1 PP2C family protein-serine/threonine phosphatase [Thermoanaerobaculales bacterium]
MPRRSISLFRRIEQALETIALGSTPLETIHDTAQLLARVFAEDLGIRGGRIYSQDNGSYELVTTFGDVAKAPLGLRIWRTYPPFEQLLDTGSLVMSRDDARLDQRLEADLGTRDWFAAVSVADGRFVLSFDILQGIEVRDDLIATLNIIRLAINQKLRDEQMQEVMEEARLIQSSILPRHLPRTGDFEIAARSVTAEVVGGDFYDVITLAEDLFVVVVADATGHGLPAALQVRDVFTGLRMGLSREFKLTATVERLNTIIHRSRLATKFVSLFLAELHANGTVLYCNAGHPPALLIHDDGLTDRLQTGGMIIGPTPSATYEIGITQIDPGELLVLYTDGVIEARAPGSTEEYGEDRLLHVVHTARRRDPVAIVERVIADLAEFSQTSHPTDDQTVVVVKRRAEELEEAPA